MKIGIVGATSFLGHRLIVELVNSKKKFELKLFTSSSSFHFDNYPNIKYINYHFPKIPLDVSDFLNLDIIYFCSALGLEKRDNVSDESIIGINTYEPISLSLQLEKHNFSGKLVTFGTYFEIGQNDEFKRFSEHDISFSSRPLFNTYCLSKRMLTNFYNSKKHKINWYHFILPNFYGKGERPHRLIPYIINAISLEETVNITQGTQVRQYLHIKDIVDILTKLTHKDFFPSMYNLAPNEFFTVNEVIEIIVKSTSKNNIKFNRINRYDENMKVIIADNTKMKKEFSWEPSISLKNGIMNYNNL